MRTISHYDRTCDSTEEWIFFNHHKELLKRPDPTWHFDRDELHAIAIIYFKLQRDAGCDVKEELPSKCFSNVMHIALGMADDALIQRIFSALDSITSRVSLRNWINAMSLFLRGSLKQKIKYCFKVYDVSGKNEIRREQMVNLMRKFVFKHQDEEVDESVKDLVDIVIKKMDVDKDGIISYADYATTVMKDPMLLECFGQCLPDDKHVTAFLFTFTDKLKQI
jgi:Ca2+-binding EF-hand superfamily protein